MFVYFRDGVYFETKDTRLKIAHEKSKQIENVLRPDWPEIFSDL